MLSGSISGRLVVGCVVAAVASLATAQPNDPSAIVLEALRDRGHADLALEFLAIASDDPLVSEEFRARVPFERVATLVDSARSVRDVAKRSALVAQAAAASDALVGSVPTGQSPEAASALADAVGAVALAVADDARQRLLSARREADEGERSGKLKDARDALAAASERLQAAADRYAAEREGLKGVDPGSPAGLRRRELGGRVAQARLLAGRLTYERGESLDAQDPGRAETLRQAAEGLRGLYEKYSKWMVGLYAHLYEAKCYRELGEQPLAVAALEDLTTQAAVTPELKRLVTLAHAERVALELGAGDAVAALKGPLGWYEGLDNADRSGAEVATLRYWLGRAALAAAEKLAERDVERRRLLTSAREWFGDSARVASEVQADARAEWARAASMLGIDTSEPKDFAEAYARGKDAIAALAAVRVRIESEGAEAASSGLVAQASESRDAAQAAFAAALKLAKRKEAEAQVNEARYFLAWLDWDAGDDAKAVAKAEFVATKFPDDPSAELAARVGLAALERLAIAANNSPDERSQLAGRIQRFASFAAERWPSGETANAAYALRLGEALRAGNLKEADAVVASAPADCQGDLRTRLAVAGWERALADKQADAAGRSDALRRLAQAVGSPAEGTPSLTRVAAVLYLAQGRLEGGDAGGAASLLTRERDGPFTLLLAGLPPTDTPRFAQEAARVAARAFARSGDARASEALELLEKSLESAPPAERLRGLLALGAKLQQDLASASSPEVRGPLASLTERVAGQVAALAKEAPQDWNVSLWVAQVAALAADSRPEGPARRKALEVARDAYNALAERAAAEPSFAPTPTAALAARLAAAESERKLGDYAAAYEAFKRVLVERNALLEAQRAAAATLQSWGASEGDTQRLERALAGAEPGEGGKNVVWGWAKLAGVASQAARSDPSRLDLFYEAWLNVARTRYQVALASSGSERQNQLRKATSTIRAMQRQYPELGGATRRAEFDALLRDVQSAAGEQVTGLDPVGGKS
jgi:hypothetical protein